MMVPSRRLLLVAGTVWLPCLTLVGLATALSPIAAVASAFALVVVVVDAVFSTAALDGVRIEIPPLIHAIRGRASTFRLALRGIETMRAVRVALDAPPELSVDIPEFVLTKEAPDHAVSFRALERGEHELRSIHVETRSKFGLWLVRSTKQAKVSIRTYPDLSRDQRRIAMSAATRSLLGEALVRQVGRGREFDRLREYVPGDSYEDIHWRATGKRGRPVTKLFSIERARQVYIAVDASRLSTRPVVSSDQEAAPSTLLERYVNAALILGSIAERQGDFFGLLTFSDSLHSFVRASRGRGHFRACREAMVGLSGRRVNPDYSGLFSFLSERVRRRSLVYVLTSLDDPAITEDFIEACRVASRRHLLVAATAVPPSVQPLFREPLDGVDQVYAALAGHLVWKRLRTARSILARNGVQMLSFPHEAAVPAVIESYRRIKVGQTL
jgi:uncharacterized protein (DUF58 family)